MSKDHPSTVESVGAAARDAGIQHLDLQFTDVMGAVKAVTIPVAQLGDAVAHGVWFDGSSVESIARTAESDMYLAPDLSTFAVNPGSASRTGRLICWARTPDGEPYAGDPRGALARVARRAADLGYEYRLGPEVEFFLLRRDATGQVVPPDRDQSGYFDLAADEGVAVRQSTVEALLAQGVDINSAHHEVAPGQHEVDLGAAECLRAADAVVSLRSTLRALARQDGMLASFMPKPFFGTSGSGLHVHQSLQQNGHTAFADDTDDYGLSPVAKHFIAGQLQHAAGMCAVLSPLVNSYKRLIRGYEAPVFVSWARTNRGALVRVPHVTRREATRVELRSPDPACNPYLAFAVMLRCGLDGIERRLPLPPAVEESLFGFDDAELERRNVAVLPGSLAEALDAFEADAVVRDALGDHLADRFLEARRMEWDEYRAQVTGWELERYLERA